MLNEADTRAKLIDPQLHKAGWKEEFILRDRYITKGEIYLAGEEARRKEKKKPDYILLYPQSFPLAIVEAKDESSSPMDGLQQAKEYAQMLDTPFAYSTNGHGIEEFDFTTNIQSSLTHFPSPAELWARYRTKEQGRLREPPPSYETDLLSHPLTYPYYFEPGGKSPYYFQEVAIKKVIEAILEGKNRILLAMATGTGKTYIAFQIVWKLKKSGYLKRPILYIADRIFLRDQAHREFAPFGEAREFIEEGRAPKNREIYFSMYQSLYSEREEKRLYQEYPLELRT